jgi:signal transduction histidine kinase
MSSAPPNDAQDARASGAAAWTERARRKVRRNALGLRLTLGYAALFALSAAALFALTYALLGTILRQQDEAFVETHFAAAEAAYGRGGLAEVRRLADDLRSDDRGEELLFRVAGEDNATLLLVPPDEWEASDFAQLERRRPEPGERVRLWSEEEQQEIDVLTRELSRGTYLQVGISSDERDDVLESFPRVFLIVALPLVAFALLGGAVMAHRALRPIRRLVDTLGAIATTGDVRERAPEPAEQGEFADLFRLFNQMLARIEALVGRLRGTLDDVAHDLRTPLTRARSAADLALQRDRSPEAYREALAQVLAAAEAAQATLDAIMDVAEAEAGTMHLALEPVPLADLLRDVAAFYELAAEAKGVELRVQADAPGVALADRSRLRQALANLVGNAVKYTPPGGSVALEASAQGEEVQVVVRDTGPGIPADDLDRIWERHYRGESGRHERGLGLGLSLVRAIARAHGGEASVESREGHGSTFRLHVPAA